MSSWGRNDQAVTANSTTTRVTSNGAPIGTYVLVKAGGGPNANFGNTSGTRAAADVNLFSNVTSGAFVSGIATGVFGVSATEQSNNTLNNSKEVGAHAGWNFRKAGTGPVLSFVIVDPGEDLANGETITVSNGTSNATGVITTNATSNIVSVVLTSGGAGFTDTTSAVVEFDRQQYLSAITVTGSTSGYSNDDVIVASNGISDGVATISTNSTGGFTNSEITITNIGLFSNTAANGSVVLTVFAANGDPSDGTGATFVANLTSSTTGDVTITLGGRAGRVQYETLVAMGSLGAQTAAFGTPAVVNDATSDNALFPGV
jgi:hypothetical protein